MNTMRVHWPAHGHVYDQDSDKVGIFAGAVVRAMLADLDVYRGISAIRKVVTEP